MWWLAALFFEGQPSVHTVPVAPSETLQVTEAGAGPAVVIVPGLFGSAFAFRQVIPRLVEAGYRVLVIEPLGVGSSARPERADYSLAAQTDRIAAALDTLGVVRAVVVAHAVGAGMAFRLAYRRPDLVRGIVSLEGGPTESATTPGFRRAMRFAPWIKLFGGVGLVRKKIRRYLVAASGDTTWVSDSVVAGYTAGAAKDLDATLKAYLRMARAREPEELKPHLAEVRCPVRLLLGGTPHEGRPRDAEIAQLEQALAAVTVDTLAGVGHFIYEERPEAVVRAVQESLGTPP